MKFLFGGKGIILLFVIGLSLRVFLMATTFHPDVRVLNSIGSLIGQKKIFNVYDYVQGLPDGNSYKIDFPFDELPIINYIFGFQHLLFSPLFNPEIQQHFLLNTQSIFGNFGLFYHLFLIKFPLLIFDLATAFILMKLFKDKRAKMLALVFWLFNPVTLYATFMMGTYDIIPLFFMVLSLYFLNTNKLNLSALSLGFGGAAKFFPILFAPIFIFSLGKSLKEKVIFLMLIVAPYILTILPYLPSRVFRQTALFAPQIQKTFFAQILLSGGEALIIVVFFLLVFYFFVSKVKITEENSYLFFLTPLLITLSFTHYHPQWFLWLTPFFVVSIIKGNKFWIPLLIIFSAFVFSTFLFEPSLTTRLFSPLFPSLSNAPGLSDFFNKFKLIEVFYLKSISQTVFAATSLWFILVNFFGKRTTDDT